MASAGSISATLAPPYWADLPRRSDSSRTWSTPIWVICRAGEGDIRHAKPTNMASGCIGCPSGWAGLPSGRVSTGSRWERAAYSSQARQRPHGWPPSGALHRRYCASRSATARLPSRSGPESSSACPMRPDASASTARSYMRCCQGANGACDMVLMSPLPPLAQRSERCLRHGLDRLRGIKHAEPPRVGSRAFAERRAHAFEEAVALALDAVGHQVAAAGALAAGGHVQVKQEGQARTQSDDGALEGFDQVLVQATAAALVGVA